MFKPFQNAAIYGPIVFLSIVQSATEYSTERDLPDFLNFSRTLKQLLRISKKKSIYLFIAQKKTSILAAKAPSSVSTKLIRFSAVLLVRQPSPADISVESGQMTRNFGKLLAEVCGDRQNSFVGVISKVWHSAKFIQGKFPKPKDLAAAQVRDPTTLMRNLASTTMAKLLSTILLACLPEQQPKRTQSKELTLPQAELLSLFSFLSRM